MPATENLKETVSSVIEAAPKAIEVPTCASCNAPIPQFEERMKDIREDLAADAAVKLADYKREQDAEVRQMVNAEMKKWRDDQKPPTPAEIEALLNQEYATITIKLPFEGAIREFKLSELPQRIELQWYKILKEQILKRTTDIAGLSFQLLEGSIEKKIQYLMEAFEPTFDLLADAAVLSLNPRGEIQGLDKQWVQDNLSSNRIYNIVMAQVQINKLRDFLFSLFRDTSNALPNQ